MLAAEWMPLAEEYRARADVWVVPHLARRTRNEPHAIEDFLFEYYPYSPNKLRTWHPGHGVLLEGVEAHAYLKGRGYRSTDEGVTADITWLAGKEDRLRLAIDILANTAERPAVTGCFGLHEWAMVYRLAPHDVRHPYLQLRLPPGEIAATVDEVGLRCTHIDAFRFFTPEATPLNALVPTRDNQPHLEQPGCLHAAMDLYKYAFWFSPLVPSDLILDCFENAMRAREIDMRASPYDMEPFGLEPIRVETAEGRRAYLSEQQEVIRLTKPLRSRLLFVLRNLSTALVDSVTGPPSSSHARS